jgi:hypothetical protein
MCSGSRDTAKLCGRHSEELYFTGRIRCTKTGPFVEALARHSEVAMGGSTEHVTPSSCHKEYFRFHIFIFPFAKKKPLSRSTFALRKKQLVT